MKDFNLRMRLIRTECRDGIKKAREEYEAKISKTVDYETSKRVELMEKAEAEYHKSCEPIRAHALEQSEALFEAARNAVESAMVKAPSSDQLAYLQVLSLRSSLKDVDLDQAAPMMKGNALAESALNDLAEKHDIIRAETGSAPDFRSMRHSFPYVIGELNTLEDNFKDLIDRFMKSVEDNPLQADRFANIEFSLDSDYEELQLAEEACRIYGE